MSKNEQKYADVIEILDYYENLVTSVCNLANIQPTQVRQLGWANQKTINISFQQVLAI